MKKLAFIIPLLVLFAGCTVIHEPLTGPRVAVVPADVAYYDYYPAAEYYSPYYPSVYVGLGWGWGPAWFPPK